MVDGDDGGIRRFHIDEARIDDVPDPCGGGRVDRGLVLAHARADPSTRDYQKLARATDRRPQRFGFVEIAVAHLAARLSAVRELRRSARDEDQVASAPLSDQLVGGEPAVSPGRAGHRDAGHATASSAALTHQPCTCGRKRWGTAILATGPDLRSPASMIHKACVKSDGPVCRSTTVRSQPSCPGSNAGTCTGSLKQCAVGSPKPCGGLPVKSSRSSRLNIAPTGPPATGGPCISRFIVSIQP